MKLTLWLLGVLAVGGYLFATSLVPVKETELVVVAQFGKPVRIIDEAGLAFKLPDPIQTVSRLDKRVQLLPLNAGEFVTRDRRNLVVNAFALWRVVEPKTFLASVRNMETAEVRLESLANSEIGAALGSQPMEAIFTVTESAQQMPAVFEQVTRATNKVARDEFGIEVVAVRPSRFGFPKQNLLAIYKRMESERDRIARQYRAEGQEEAARIQAETEREVSQLRAEAYRDAQRVKGESEAKAARVYAEAFESDADYYKFVRSMEAYEKILGKDTTFVLSTDSPILQYLLTPPGNPKP